MKSVKLPASPDMVIVDARLVTPSRLVKTNVVVDDGKIAGLTRSTVSGAGEEIHLPRSSLLLPGIVDIHAHMRDLELSYKGDFESEGGAAAVGGVTTVVDMPNSRPPTLDQETFELKKNSARGRCPVDYGLNVGVYHNLDQLESVAGCLAYGEVFVGPSTGGLVIKYEELAEALRVAVRTGRVVYVHAEDASFFRKPGDGYDHCHARPPESEWRAVEKVLRINRGIGARVHICHVSTRTSLEIISRYKKMGMPVTCEVTPHHLVLTEEAYHSLGPVAKMNPPLRGPTDVEAMILGISSGEIDVISTDHAPHTLEEKQSEPDAPSGVPGFETIIPAVLTYFEDRQVPPTRFVRLTSTKPARLLGLEGKGFGVGRDADFVVVERKRRAVNPDFFLSKAKYSPFEGMELRYWPVMTIVRGSVVAEAGDVIIKNRGAFLPPSR